ncbi:uncharacterized protein LOC129121459 [Agelaius phoeniceus]|uniref:uncharacterized protein LOC129121459 n=1 Tax=Agelaius phoeniceus TaxID=39638 RepID=UPI00405504B5
MEQPRFLWVDGHRREFPAGAEAFPLLWPAPAGLWEAEDVGAGALPPAPGESLLSQPQQSKRLCFHIPFQGAAQAGTGMGAEQGRCQAQGDIQRCPQPVPAAQAGMSRLVTVPGFALQAEEANPGEEEDEEVWEDGDSGPQRLGKAQLQDRKNHLTDPIFAQSFGVGAAKPNGLQLHWRVPAPARGVGCWNCLCGCALSPRCRELPGLNGGISEGLAWD